MAVDSRDKRASVLFWNRAIARLGPNPDAAITGQGDRQQMGLVYRGILASGAAPASTDGTYHNWQINAV